MRRSALKQRGRKFDERHAEAFGPQARRCHALPCCACVATRMLQPSRTEAHHEPPRSRGGVDRDTVPLCSYHHRMRHSTTCSAFWERVGLRLEDVLSCVREASPTPGDPHENVPY